MNDLMYVRLYEWTGFNFNNFFNVLLNFRVKL